MRSPPADIVLAIDVTSHKSRCLYGREAFDAVAEADEEVDASSLPRFATVGVNLSKPFQDLELVAAVCAAVKGSGRQ